MLPSLVPVISMVDSTNMLCPLFDEIEILIPGDSPNISRVWTKRENLICYRNEEKWLSSSSNSSGHTKALRPFRSSTNVLSADVDLIMLLLCDM